MAAVTFLPVWYLSSLSSLMLVQVRSMKDNYGDKEEAGPSTAVQMTGLSAVPVAGDDFNVSPSLDEVCYYTQLMPCMQSLGDSFLSKSPY